MSGMRITQQMPDALPGRRYGNFAGKPLVKRGAGVLCIHPCAIYEVIIKEKRLARLIASAAVCKD
jgi:hypothetical protein